MKLNKNKKNKIILCFIIIIVFIILIFVLIPNFNTKNDTSQAIDFFEQLNSLNEEDIQEIHVVNRKNVANIVIINKTEDIKNILEIFKNCNFSKKNEIKLVNIDDDVLYNINYVQKGYYASATINIYKDKIYVPVSAFKVEESYMNEVLSILSNLTK